MLRNTPLPDPGKPPSRMSSQELRRYDLLLAGLDLLDQAIAVFDATPKLVTWNKALLRLLDFPEKLVRVGTPFEEFVRFNAERGEYGDGELEKLVSERMAAARAFLPHYLERERPNGKILAVRGVPIPNLGFVSLWTDVTEQRRAEAVIHQQNLELEGRVKARTQELENANARLAHANAEIDQIADALRHSEEKLKTIIDSIPALIAYVGRDEVYQFANRGYAEWFGLSKDEIVGRTILSVFGPELYPVVRQRLAVVDRGERVSYEYARKLANGRTVHARSVIVPEMSAQGDERGEGRGEVRGYFVLSTDITEQKASQAALIQAQKMEAVGQLTGGLAHDFNNLLTIIIGNLAALQAQAPPGTLTEHLDPALHAARRGAELIKRLLTFSRGQALEPRAVEVGALVQDMAQLLARSLTENVRLHTSLPDAPLHAFVDAHQLENALLNLALNARDAMPDGGDLRIAISERHIDEGFAALTELQAGDYVQIDVADTGSGIDPELMPRLFEPFFTTKPFGRGSGLGLAMVYGFVRQSGGNIRIRSTPDQGTTVTFVLPRAEAPAVADESAATLALNPVRSVAGPVLLVEDEPEVRRIIRLQLTALGHAVIEAADGVEAWLLLEAVPDIALLVTDTIMPGGIGGRELVTRTRALRPDMPILMITGYASDNALAGTAELDVPVLRKPFDQAALAAALDALPDYNRTGSAEGETPRT
ncbi:PAS-domain containing protein [Aromatoleum toluclasticum]|uniref:PAS-domain containing protein n=1 Tax=Aromatoleum toluclasticum TaxID=92003 RepID=UPI001D1955E3|nr:PAS-domain containing protein [Aromatoleum toluclasticum]MCC4115607.1 PAS-domain containing protein [Aromatoleum toluclasticum]